MSLRPADRLASVKDLQADVAAYQAGFATSAEEARAWRRFKRLMARNKRSSPRSQRKSPFFSPLPRLACISGKGRYRE